MMLRRAGLCVVLLAAFAPGQVAADAPALGFGGPTLDALPANASPGYKRTQDMPIAIRLSADRTRIAELDWAVISACNFDARIDWGRLTDIPLAPDGSFATHQDYPLRGTGKTAALDVTGRVGPDRIDGTTRLDAPAVECGMAATWTATPALVGTSAQGTPAVLQLSADRQRVARLMLVWIPRCRGGAGLDAPENAIGLDQRRVARLDPHGRFATKRRATALQTTAEIALTHERVSGRVAGARARADFRATILLGRTYRCVGGPVRLTLAG